MTLLLSYEPLFHPVPGTGLPAPASSSRAPPPPPPRPVRLAVRPTVRPAAAPPRPASTDVVEKMLALVVGILDLVAQLLEERAVELAV